MNFIILLTFFVFIALMLSFYYFKALARSAEDVYQDLIDEVDFSDGEVLNLANIKFLSDSLGKLGLFQNTKDESILT